jgi:hypothetical protein
VSNFPDNSSQVCKVLLLLLDGGSLSFGGGGGLPLPVGSGSGASANNQRGQGDDNASRTHSLLDDAQYADVWVAFRRLARWVEHLALKEFFSFAGIPVADATVVADDAAVDLGFPAFDVCGGFSCDCYVGVDFC